MILRILTVMAAVLMIQEEKKVGEFGPEHKPEEVDDACGVSLMINHRCGGEISGRVIKVVLKAVSGMIGEEFGMSAAGAGGDKENELDDGDL